MTQKNNDSALDTPPSGEDGVTGESVADYLARHPDFFTDKLELLSEMTAPSRWTGDGVVDMQRFLAERRLDEIDELRNCAQEVIETSRSNMSVQTRTHAAVLAAMSAVSLEHLIRVVNDDLPLLLDVDVVILGFEQPQDSALPPDVHKLPPGTVDTLLDELGSIRLFRDMEDDGTIFGAGAGLVRSAAIARLRPGIGVPTGLFAMGSRGSTFQSGQGTELIGFLARVFESCLHRLAETSG
ncbi:MAG: DUF484 family protein [Proteobacteria bacterium]|nr:DUF484 family protein [Pseudomonadota bacterium]MDA1022933.1 DUF484 family protein [Pseudomonadota bacterium]